MNIQYNSEVIAIDPERSEVRLASGPTISADVFVGADGETGICRQTVVGQRDRGTPVGMSVIRCVDTSRRSMNLALTPACSVSSDTAAVLQDIPEHIKGAVKTEDVSNTTCVH